MNGHLKTQESNSINRSTAVKKLFWMLLGTGFSIAAIAFTLSDDILSYFFNLLLGLSTNIFGMIITIFFAQKYIDATEAKKGKLRKQMKF